MEVHVQDEWVVRAENLGKAYRRYARPRDRALELASCGLLRRHDQQWALRGVDFAIARGEALGVCGANGAGKSTLLKLLAGVTLPSEGRAAVAGRVTSLLELGTGFHPDFTGRENVLHAGILAGWSAREVRARLGAILDFAEIGRAVDDPVRTYSSGMGLRLAFAAALGFEPELLILDEVYAVGDQYFQSKCLERLRAHRRDGRTLLFVSHGLYDLRQMCERVLWLADGRPVQLGPALEVTNAYAAAQRARSTLGPVPACPGSPCIGQPRIVSARCSRRGSREPLEHVESGAALEIAVEWSDPRPGGALQLGIGFVRQDQLLVAAAATHLDGLTLRGAAGRAVLELPALELLSGRYEVVLYLFDEQGLQRFEERPLDAPLVVVGTRHEEGLVRLEHRWRLESCASAEREAA